MLTHDQARQVYDQLGGAPWPRFYKRRAIADILEHGALDSAEHVLEFGCGQGDFAEQLLSEVLPTSTGYIGLDQSPRMVRLAGARLKRFRGRAVVLQTSGEIRFPIEAESQDRVLSSYVLDLLSEADIRLFLQESHRVLRPAGRACLIGLGPGIGACSRLFSRTWSAVHRIRPELVGGCRPLLVRGLLAPGAWQIRYATQVVVCSVPSEVLVLEKRTQTLPAVQQGAAAGEPQLLPIAPW